MGLTYKNRPVAEWQTEWANAQVARIDFDLRDLQLGQSPPLFWSESTWLAHAWDVTLFLDSRQACDALRAWFDELRGPLQGFWWPEPDEAMAVMGSPAPGTITIKAQGLAGAYADAPALHLWCMPPAGTPVAAAVTGVTDNGDGTETVTLDQGIQPDSAWSIHRLLYVRLSGELAIEWLAEGLARARMRLIELPHEYAAAEMGQVPVWYYELADMHSGQTWRYTSWVQDLPDPTGAQQTFSAAQITHGAEVRAPVSEARATELRMDVALPVVGAILAGHPVSVTVTRQYIGQAPAVTWSGMVDGLDIDGRTATARVSPWPWHADATIPRRPFSERCPYALFGPGCELDPAPHTVTATVVSATGSTIILSGSWPAVGAHHYAAGILVADGQTWDIADSTAPVSGQITLMLSRYCSLPAGASCMVRPGCDGRYETCLAYGNQENFGGMPRPLRNLTLLAMPVPSPGGGKK